MTQASRSVLADGVAAAGAILVLPFVAAGITRPFMDECATSMERFATGSYAWVILVVVVAVAGQVIARSRWWRVASSALFGASYALAMAVALPNLAMGDIDRGRLKRTAGDMRAIGFVLEEHRREHAAYPDVASVQQLQPLTRSRLPVLDGWGRAYVLSVEPQRYRVLSLGSCGMLPAVATPGPVLSLKQPLVFENGAFVRYAASEPR